VQIPLVPQGVEYGGRKRGAAAPPPSDPLLGDPSARPASDASPPPLPPLDAAHQLYLTESLKPPSSWPATRSELEPFSLPWFLEIEQLRYGRYGRWIPRLLEFNKHAGERLLGLGRGLGTDWAQYARHGAAVVACSPAADHLALVRRQFELRHLEGKFLHAGPTALPVESASIDVACVSCLADGGVDPPALVEELYRVLKPGGKVLTLAPAYYDVSYWFQLFCPWGVYLRGRPGAGGEGAAERYSGKSLRRLFAAFTEHRVHKRHLRRADIPHVWRWAPPGILARLMGRALLLKAFKPLSAAMAVPLAA
jgi:SAM-dependent methyltransferase